MNYYNEFYSPAAAILRELIADKLIPEGHVDDRSITDVQPSDLDGYTQCHFFAGIGGWSYALQLAEWPTDRNVWTGSCPCQPFSSAGKHKGKSDERHLWPAWFRLIKECRPSTVFGEQVASAIAHGWLDDVYQGLEAEGYAVGSAVLPACSIGAPHKRDRLWFVADSGRKQCFEPRNSCGYQEKTRETSRIDASCCDVANTQGVTDERTTWAGSTTIGGQEGNNIYKPFGASLMVNTNKQRPQGWAIHPECRSERSTWETGLEWATGADGKSRPVVSGIRLLANGFPERVACLHGFGNAIVPQVAAEFIKAYMNIDGDLYVEVK